MSDKNNPHIAGRYAIIVAFIGLIGTFGAVYLSDYLERNREQKKNEVKKAISKENFIIYDIVEDEGYDKEKRSTTNTVTFVDERDRKSSFKRW